ncbi:MAG TPA: crosslink repair DNA glycosylase YcaQ family protein, partial [Actinomycetes bacterium]|nr:crosslink repair DNA glycosylase YcaQ family protein [Actinomycetes bacterium]
MPAPAAAAAKLGWGQVAAWRAARHRLEERAPATAMLEVVAGIAGLHAQVMSSAELTLWARVEGPAPAAVRRALWEERSLVKTWAMRGTLHLLPAAALGRLCFAPSQGQQVRFTRPDAWLGGWTDHDDPDEAMAEVTRRFLAAPGPVT